MARHASGAPPGRAAAARGRTSPAHHVGRLAVHFSARGVSAGEAEAVHGVSVSGDALGGEVGFIGVGGEQAGDQGDRSVVASGVVFRGVGDGWGEAGAKGVEKRVSSITGPLVGEVREVDGVHAWCVSAGHHDYIA